jgi:hypothetical protein
VENVCFKSLERLASEVISMLTDRDELKQCSSIALQMPVLSFSGSLHCEYSSSLFLNSEFMDAEEAEVCRNIDCWNMMGKNRILPTSCEGTI